MLKKIICFSVIYLALIFSVNASSGSLDSDINVALAETHLDHLRDDYELWIVLSLNDFSSRALLSESITKKLVRLSVIAFSVERIKSPRLEVLCLINNNPEVYQYHAHKNLSQIAGRFLGRINAEVEEKIAESQKILYGSGCYVSPKGDLK